MTRQHVPSGSYSEKRRRMEAAIGSRVYPLTPGAAAQSLRLVGPSLTAGKTTTAPGQSGHVPVPKVSWMDEHRHGDEGASDYDEGDAA